jgi:ankyrin repeat protein
MAACLLSVANAAVGADTVAAPGAPASVSNSALDGTLSSLSARLHDLTPSGRAASRELLKSAERGDFGRVRELATSGEPNVNARNDSGWTALFFAVRADDLASVRLLLERGADPSLRENEIGSVALATGEHLMLGGRPLLRYARSAEVARHLLAHGARADATDADGYRAIHWSSAQVMAVLLDAGTDPDSRQGTVRRRGITYPSDAATALITASGRADHAAVRLLISAGANVNAQNRWRRTALHEAADAASKPIVANARYLETIQLLVAAGADVNARDTSGQTALMIAAGSRSTNVINLLLGSGADRSICDAKLRDAADHWGASRCDDLECLATREALGGRGKGSCTVSMPPPEPLATPWTTSSLFNWTQPFVLVSLLAISMGWPALCWMVVRRSRSQRLARSRIAYSAYAVCALIVSLFQLLLYVEGPEIYVAFGQLIALFGLPAAVAGAVAVAMTAAIRSDMGLSVLGAATLALGGLQSLALAGLIGTAMNGIARAYVLLVLCVIVYRRRWWRRE